MAFMAMMIIATTLLSPNALAQEKAAATSPVQNEKVATKSVDDGSTTQVADGSEALADDSVAGHDVDSVAAAASAEVADNDPLLDAQMENEGFHRSLKRKFVEGNAGFMSLVALALVLGLAFCIERIIYLTLSDINTHQFMEALEAKLDARDFDGAKQLCRDTRGPVASICYQGVLHISEPLDAIERSITSYGSVQVANLEKGCSWITMFIAIAPSLGFLGTVIGMVMSFDRIQDAGDISPTIVADGMKVALITTIFGIIVAVVLQLFYNYILSKIEYLTTQMEESAVTLMDIITRVRESEK